MKRRDMKRNKVKSNWWMAVNVRKVIQSRILLLFYLKLERSAHNKTAL